MTPMSNVLVKEDSQPESGDFATLPTAEELRAQAEAPRPTEQKEAPSPKEEPKLPEKFRGKSVEEIVESYANLESELGRKSQEIGSLRDLTDQLLELKRTEDLSAAKGGQSSDVPELTDDDVWNNPRSAIETVARREASRAEQRVESLEQSLALERFEGRHPTFRQDQQDPAFQQFVSQSAYRQNLARKVLEGGDLAAADELWSAWEEAKPAQSKEDVQTETVDRSSKEAAAAEAQAIAPRGGNESNSAPEPVVRRADLVKKRIEDPDGYYDPAFQNWMLEKIKKGLVK